MMRAFIAAAAAVIVFGSGFLAASCGGGTDAEPRVSVSDGTPSTLENGDVITVYGRHTGSFTITGTDAFTIPPTTTG